MPPKLKPTDIFVDILDSGILFMIGWGTILGIVVGIIHGGIFATIVGGIIGGFIGGIIGRHRLGPHL